MDTKYCPKCGKELPREANFCPYCMTKLIAENGTEIPAVKKSNRKKLYIIICLMLIIMALEIVILLVSVNDSDKGAVSKKLNEVEQEDYSQYLGVWIDEENKDTADISMTGGRKIEICKVIGEDIVFNIENYSSYSQKAYLEYITVQLINGKGTFSFSDDGFGNSGTGEIKLNKGKIYARVELDNSRVGGEWDLSMDADFVQVEKYTVGQVIDIEECLTTYDSQKIKFGNRTDIEKYGDSISYVYENGITIDVQDFYDTDELYILKIWIDYDMLKSDYNYCYKGIDNNSTMEDVKKVFEEANVPEEDLYYADSFFQYWSSDEDRVTEIYFDDNGYVSSIDYSILY